MINLEKKLHESSNKYRYILIWVFDSFIHIDSNYKTSNFIRTNLILKQIHVKAWPVETVVCVVPTSRQTGGEHVFTGVDINFHSH